MAEEVKAPFPVVDPVEDLSKATPAAAEPLSEVNFAEVEMRAHFHYEALELAVGTAKAALAEIVALSSSPSVNTTRLGAIAQRALDALPVT